MKYEMSIYDTQLKYYIVSSQALVQITLFEFEDNWSLIYVDLFTICCTMQKLIVGSILNHFMCHLKGNYHSIDNFFSAQMNNIVQNEFFKTNNNHFNKINI